MVANTLSFLSVCRGDKVLNLNRFKPKNQFISSRFLCMIESSLRIHPIVASLIHSYFDNVVTKFMTNNRTNAWETDAHLLAIFLLAFVTSLSDSLHRLSLVRGYLTSCSVSGALNWKTLLAWHGHNPGLLEYSFIQITITTSKSK